MPLVGFSTLSCRVKMTNSPPGANFGCPNQPEAGAARIPGAEFQRASVRVRDAVGNRETEPRSLSDLLRGEKRLEDPAPKLLADAGTIVSDLQDPVLPEYQRDLSALDLLHVPHALFARWGESGLQTA